MISNISYPFQKDIKIRKALDSKIIWSELFGFVFKSLNINFFKRCSYRVSNFVTIVFFYSIVSASPLFAIETIKASALKLDLEQNSMSNFSRSSPQTLADSCLPLLKQVRLSSAGNAVGQNRHKAGHKSSMPMTLGFLIGVRVALGPKEVVKSGRRVQIGPELLQRLDTGESYALAIASYRRCKDNKALKIK